MMGLFIGFLLFTAVVTSVSAALLKGHAVKDFFLTGTILAVMFPAIAFIQGCVNPWFYVATVAFQTMLLAGSLGIQRGMRNASYMKTSAAFRVVLFSAAATVVGAGALISTFF